MPPTPVRHVRVPGQLWDAAKAKAESEFRNVSDVIVECLRNYTRTTTHDLGGVIASVTADERVPAGSVLIPGAGGELAVMRAPAVGTGGNGDAGAVATEGVQARDATAAVPTPAPRKRKPPKVTTMAELAKPPEQREAVTPPAMDLTPARPARAYDCCKHCKSAHGGHGAPCMNGCHG